MTVDADGNMVIETPDGSAVVNVDEGQRADDAVHDGEDGQHQHRCRRQHGHQTPDGTSYRRRRRRQRWSVSEDGTVHRQLRHRHSRGVPQRHRDPAGFTVIDLERDGRRHIADRVVHAESDSAVNRLGRRPGGGARRVPATSQESNTTGRRFGVRRLRQGRLAGRRHIQPRRRRRHRGRYLRARPADAGLRPGSHDTSVAMAQIAAIKPRAAMTRLRPTGARSS